MTISILHENIVTLSDAAKVLPRRRTGRKPHTATLYRWASSGLHGIKLEVIKVGGTTCTSHQALQRFCDRLTTAGSSVPPVLHPNARGRVEQELDDLGIK